MRHAFADAADRMGRRDFIALAGSATAWTTLACAQAKPVIGYLGSESPERYASRLEAFREGLADAGYAEGRSGAIEYWWADGQYSRLPALAGAGRPRRTVIVAPGGAGSRWRQNRRRRKFRSCSSWAAILLHWASSTACPGQAAISPACRA
jgi:putative ABC transport system substrate-binding protein